MFWTIKLCTHSKLNCLKLELIICIKMDLALNNQQRLISHKTQPTNLDQSVLYLDTFSFVVFKEMEDCVNTSFSIKLSMINLFLFSKQTIHLKGTASPDMKREVSELPCPLEHLC